MKKLIIIDKIFYDCKRATQFSSLYTWGMVKKMLNEHNISLQDEDVLEIGFEPGWSEGDSARDDMYFVSLKRNREETNDEFEKRKVKSEELKLEIKKRRFEEYMKLKKEFESNSSQNL